jgi:hypothetical protein
MNGTKLRFLHRTGPMAVALRSASHVQGEGESVMLGPRKPRRLDAPIAVSLEDLVPQNHFFRHLEARLDLSFVRD